MTSKRQKQADIDPRAQVVDAALRLAAARDWANIPLSDIASEAGITLADLARSFECREDIITAYARRIDADVLEGFGGYSEGSGSPRDLLFDILMDRFERLKRDRAAVVSILGSFTADPKQMVIALPHVGKSMAWMLEACGVETIGWRGALRVAGLSAVYLYVLRIWREDDSADMGKVMAALDRMLARTERWAGTLGF